MALFFQVSLLIRRELTERAKDFSLILDDVAITELSFSREYTAAVEAKQVGELVLKLKETLTAGETRKKKTGFENKVMLAKGCREKTFLKNSFNT